MKSNPASFQWIFFCNTIQRAEFGMDFENMTVEELKTVAGWEVARRHEIMGRPLPDGYPVE